MADKLRLLIVGVGSIGERHLRCFARTNRVELSICEINDELRQQVSERYGPMANYRDLEVALADKPDIAVVSTPAHLHLPIALELAAAGVHLLIEKPLSTTTADIQQLRELAADKGLVIAIGYVRRVDPVLIEMRSAVLAGQFGKILQLVATSGQHFPHYRPAYRETYYRDHNMGGGAIQDALTHMLNVGEWFLGSLTDLAADAAHQRLEGVSVEDTVHVIGRHGDVLANYSLNQHQAPNETTLTVVGDRGTAQYQAHRNRWQSMAAPDDPWQRHEGPEMERDDHFVRQAEMFLQAVSGQGPVACSLDEAEQSLHVNLAILKAVRERVWCAVR